MRRYLNKTVSFYRKTDIIYEGDLDGTTSVVDTIIKDPFRIEVLVSSFAGTTLGELTLVGSTTETLVLDNKYKLGVKSYTFLSSIASSTSVKVKVYSKSPTGASVFHWVSYLECLARLSSHSSSYTFQPFGEVSSDSYTLYVMNPSVKSGDLARIDSVHYEVMGVYNTYGANSYHHSQISIKENKELSNISQK